MEGIEYRDTDAFLDEIPAAYKAIDQVMADAADWSTVRHTLRQIVNVKGLSRTDPSRRPPTAPTNGVRVSDQPDPAAPTAETDAVSALVLRPGDRVLVGLSIDVMAREDLQEIVRQLHDRFPGVEFTVVSGVTGLAVQREDR